MLILGIDMGSKNTAWALSEDDKVLSFGMLENPIYSLSDNFFLQKLRFINELKKIMAPLKQGDRVIAERFSVRMFNPGAQVELVGVMLGLITATSHVPVKLIMAAQWKNHIANKYTNLKKVNEKKKKDKVKFEMELFLEGSKYAEYEHICDAIGITQWYYEHENEVDSKFLKKYKFKRKWK